MRPLAPFLIALLTLLFAHPAHGQSGERPVVFAAASLKNALDEINAAWVAETGKQASISYAASSALAKQIESGAPADIFISADLDWMNYVSERGLTRKETEARVVGNRLVLIAPSSAKVQATIVPGFDLAGMLGEGRLAMANVDAVPAGKYGKAALETLGVWASVQRRVAQAENVRAALALVAAEEAPLGIVYRSDALAERAVRIVAEFPENTHPSIIYPAALLAASEHPDAAGFLAFVLAPAARQSFRAHGFVPLSGTN